MLHPEADDTEDEPSPPPRRLEGGNDKEKEAEVRRRKKRRTTATPVVYKETDDEEEEQVEEEEEDNRKWLRQQQKKKQRMLQYRALVAMSTVPARKPHESNNNNNNESTDDEACHVEPSQHPRHHKPPHHPVRVANPVVSPPSVAYKHKDMPNVPNPMNNNAGEPLQKPPPLVAATANHFAPPGPAKVSNREIQVQTLNKKKQKYKVKVKLLDNPIAASRNMGISVQIIESVCREGGGFLKGSWICFHNPKALDIKPREFFQAIPGFDVSFLSPLPVEEVGKQWWKRVIELVCKQSQKPVVCFPSIRHACAALGLEPLQVQRACHTYGTQEQYDFRAYMLRYKIKSTAYVYGSHDPDFRQMKESHVERMTRWKRLMAENRTSAEGTKIPTPTPKTAPRSVPAPKRPKAVNRESDDTDTDESWSQTAAKKKEKKKKQVPSQTRPVPKKKKEDAWEEGGATKNNERDELDPVAMSIAFWNDAQMKKQKKLEESRESPQECGDWTGIEDPKAAAPEMISRTAETEKGNKEKKAEKPSESLQEWTSIRDAEASEPEMIPRAVEPEMIPREPPRRLIPIGHLQRPGSPRRDYILTETLGLFSNAFTERPDRNPNRKCIFCQDTPSEIIFEPCGHSVVCKKCATWACSKYCPKCRADILTRKLGTSIDRDVKLDLARRPQTFSPYQFMDL
jgi:hypothetical protein